MTSLINLPATYYIQIGSFSCKLFVDGVQVGMFPSKDMAEQAAREHYQASLEEV